MNSWEWLAVLVAIAVSKDEASAFAPFTNNIGFRFSTSSALEMSMSDTLSQEDSYLRWKRAGSLWEMQTATTTFTKGDDKIDLHAQLHFGERKYFEFWNSDEFAKPLDSIHYELLVDEDLLDYQSGQWKLTTPIMASPNDQAFAARYGWACQASTLDYTKPQWIHSDLSRQEFLKLSRCGNNGNTHMQPLWQVASPQSSSAAAEAVSALLVGPPTLSYASGGLLKRRLFTNLFLPGTSLANTLRALLWVTVPAPELSVMLLDWSSLLKNKGNPSALSQVALPILSSLVKLDIGQIQKFLLGQLLISSNQSNNAKSGATDPAWSILVTQRNDRALQVLRTSLAKSQQEDSSGGYRTALLYGSSHCPDLHSKLQRMGFTPTKTTWRTAWSVKEQEEDNILPALAIILSAYMGVGALDWVTMMRDVSEAWIEGNYLDSGVAGGFYLVRHVLLYLGLSKFLVDWTNSND